LGKVRSPRSRSKPEGGAVITHTPLQIDVLGRGLRQIWAIAFLPSGDRMVINEKGGAMRIMTVDGKLSEPLAGVPKVVFMADAGLLDLVLHPEFATNRTLLFTYVEPAEGGSRLTVAKAKLARDEKSIEEVTQILRVDLAGFHNSFTAFWSGYSVTSW
jgi:glucose/arabinose dehydrogenase